MVPGDDLRSLKPAAGALLTRGLRNCAHAHVRVRCGAACGTGAKRLNFLGAIQPVGPHFLFEWKSESTMSLRQKIEKLKKEEAQHKARAKDTNAQKRELMRRADARWKVLHGIAILALLDGLPEDKRKQTLERMYTKITNPRDREFLGLAPLPPKEKVQPKD